MYITNTLYPNFVVVDLLFNAYTFVLPIIACGSSMFVFVLLCITLFILVLQSS